MKEIEVKVPVKDFRRIKSILKKINAEKIKKFTKEKNILFDHEVLKLKEKDWVFRIRKFGKENILTLKTKKKGKKGFKVREEINLKFENFNKMLKLLKKIGFYESFYYEKFREEYRYKGLLISLDKTPVGNYVEIEGIYNEILDFLKILGLKLEQTLALSYLQIFRMFNKKENKMVFKKFKA